MRLDRIECAWLDYSEDLVWLQELDFSLGSCCHYQSAIVLLPQNFHQLECLVPCQSCKRLVKNERSRGTCQRKDQFEQLSFTDAQCTDQAVLPSLQSKSQEHALDVRLVDASKIRIVRHGLGECQILIQHIRVQLRCVSRIDGSAATDLLL